MTAFQLDQAEEIRKICESAKVYGRDHEVTFDRILTLIESIVSDSEENDR